MVHRRRVLVTLVVAAVVLGGVGCAEESDRNELGRGEDATSSTTERDPTGSDDASVDEGGGPEDDASADERDGPEDDGFFPVLAGPIPLTTSETVASCAAGIEGPQGEGSPVVDQRGEYCYLLGPALATSDVVQSAEAELSSTGQWQVALVLNRPGIDEFNEAAAQCFPPDSTVCPTGMLAIVVGGTVQSAPTIQQAAFERDEIVISGYFTEDEADELAEALDG